ncbi:hypothetical protein DL770_009645 [Monosporascus sp. CRB-9-2]|nr:hypothetical protein DL770_009645 [Monosporascus sp. CRB-9-2]
MLGDLPATVPCEQPSSSPATTNVRLVVKGTGRSPAARDYGLGADQIPDAAVLLADGKVVTASACENPDLYRALRGGGPGYGITLSATVKAHPNDAVAVQLLSLSLQPRASSSPSADTSSSSTLPSAWATIHQALPDLNDAEPRSATREKREQAVVVVAAAVGLCWKG